MADKVKYIYGEQFAQKLPGSNQNFYFRTVTSYEVDGNGKPIEGSAQTNLYYAPKPAARTSDGKTWTPGTADSADNFDQGGWVTAGKTLDNGKSYAFLFYTQQDADLGRIPPGKKVGDEILGATTQLSLTTSGGRFYEAVQNNLINLAVNTQPGLAKVVSAKQANVAAVAQTQTPIDAPSVPLEIPEIESDSTETNYEDLVYPTKLRDNGQDFIQFISYTYGGRSFSPGATGDLSLGIGDRKLKKTKGSVTLPIQPSIIDTNSVEWGSENLNPVTAFAASLSFGTMSNPSQAFNEAIETADRVLRENANISPAARLYFAGKAVGINGLLSRIGGGILNPNMELLFQGPQLRPFTFTFKLSPRNSKEATEVKKIIRYFKQNMSVKTTADNIFLKAPNVFQIKYIDGETRKDHTSLNRIKMCALQICNVDYTPDGSYMTFKDPDSGNPMTSYSLTLQFQELEPVTEKDYKGKDIGGPNIRNTNIGY
jgi:hypothetical protein